LKVGPLFGTFEMFKKGRWSHDPSVGVGKIGDCVHPTNLTSMPAGFELSILPSYSKMINMI
jgi:hypothetical protein